MHLTIVTGMSGAGKTQALRFFEDLGRFCIDNLPPVLMPKLMELYKSIGGEDANVVLVIDARVGSMIKELLSQITAIRNSGHQCDVLFLDATSEALVSRYKETRRTHPLDLKGGLLESIEEERNIIKELYDFADVVIDTSDMKLKELHERLKSIYASGKLVKTMNVNVMAFGFKYGAPVDADLVFDVRFLPNPFYIEELKPKTGNDTEVQEYVMQFNESRIFLKKLEEMIEFLLPLYVEEGKTSLTVAIGCTGGKHRSITMANKLIDKVRNLGYEANPVYRDIGKE